MKIKTDRKVFAQALSEVAPFAPTKAPIEILKNAKITTKGNRMKIEANDTQCSMVKYIELIECDQDGSFLIDIAGLNKFIQKLKGDVIEIAVDGTSVKLTYSKGSAEFSSVNAEDYPSFKANDKDATEICLETRILSDTISKARNFVSAETLRPQMCAIYAYVKDGEFGYCATDTHKLIHGYQAYDTTDSTADIHWLIMPSVFSALLNVCKGEDTAKIQITDSHVSYRIGNTIIHTVQAKGSYPDFKRVIPPTWEMECSLDESEMMDSLGRVSMFCPAQSRCIKLGIGRMDMTISADDIDYMKSSKENMSHGGCNGELTIGVNADHIAVALSPFNGNVLMRMTDASRPILIMSPDDDNIKTMCMPMQLLNG